MCNYYILAVYKHMEVWSFLDSWNMVCLASAHLGKGIESSSEADPWRGIV
jgi:hypothetical protein